MPLHSTSSLAYSKLKTQNSKLSFSYSQHPHFCNSCGIAPTMSRMVICICWDIGKNRDVVYCFFTKTFLIFSNLETLLSILSFPSNLKPFFIQALLFPDGSVYNTTNTFSNISKRKSVDGKSSMVCPFQRADGGARQQGNPM